MFRSISFGTVGNYGDSEIPENVLNLFSSLVNEPTKKVEYASEIIERGLAGGIALNGTFDIDAYECAIRKNIYLGKEQKKKKEFYFDDCSDDDFDDVASSGGIKIERYKASEIQDAFELLLDDDELNYAIDTIKALDLDLQEEENIFIIKVLEQALKGIPLAVSKIKEVCNRYKVVSEQIEIILSSGKTFEEMFSPA